MTGGRTTLERDDILGTLHLFLPLSVSLSELVRTFCLRRYRLISKLSSCHRVAIFCVLDSESALTASSALSATINRVCTMQNTPFGAPRNAGFSDFPTWLEGPSAFG